MWPLRVYVALNTVLLYAVYGTALSATRNNVNFFKLQYLFRRGLCRLGLPHHRAIHFIGHPHAHHQELQ
jgi:hypothetical protein